MQYSNTCTHPYSVHTWMLCWWSNQRTMKQSQLTRRTYQRITRSEVSKSLHASDQTSAKSSDFVSHQTHPRTLSQLKRNLHSSSSSWVWCTEVVQQFKVLLLLWFCFTCHRVSDVISSEHTAVDVSSASSNCGSVSQPQNQLHCCGQTCVCVASVDSPLACREGGVFVYCNHASPEA